MENVSEQFKKEHASAERSNSPMSWMVKGVTLMNALGLKGPFDGEQIRNMIEQAEKRGIQIPLTPYPKLTTIEVRNFTEAVSKQRQHMVIPGTLPVTTKATTFSVDDDLKMRIRMQQQEFELLLWQQHDTVEALEERIKEARDPLMILVNKRNPKK